MSIREKIMWNRLWDRRIVITVMWVSAIAANLSMLLLIYSALMSNYKNVIINIINLLVNLGCFELNRQTILSIDRLEWIGRRTEEIASCYHSWIDDDNDGEYGMEVCRLCKARRHK